MTGSTDLDRLLGAYLEDGPRRAPERPVDAAIAFARAHPRRRDPFLPLRPDVMGRRPAMFSPQLVWATLVLALTVGVVAVVAVGSRPTDDAPVVPPPSVPASPSPSVSPTPAPSASPTTLNLELTDPNNEITWPVVVVDETGLLVSAEANAQSDDDPVDRIAATQDPTDDSRVILTWTFQGCPEIQFVSITSGAKSITVERTECLDTLGGADLRMTLDFSQPVAASSIELQLVETPREPSSGSLPGVREAAGG